MIKMFDLIETAPCIKLLKGRHFTVNMPTEMVITEPKLVVPQVARVHYTRHYWENDEVVTAQDLHKHSKHFMGTAYHDEILMAEVWDDRGDDGHIEHIFCGWRFIPQSFFDEEMEWLKAGCSFSWNTLPLCMKPTWYEHSYLEDREKEREIFEKRKEMNKTKVTLDIPNKL